MPRKPLLRADVVIHCGHVRAVRSSPLRMDVQQPAPRWLRQPGGSSKASTVSTSTNSRRMGVRRQLTCKIYTSIQSQAQRRESRLATALPSSRLRCCDFLGTMSDLTASNNGDGDDRKEAPTSAPAPAPAPTPASSDADPAPKAGVVVLDDADLAAIADDDRVDVVAMGGDSDVMVLDGGDGGEGRQGIRVARMLFLTLCRMHRRTIRRDWR